MSEKIAQRNNTRLTIGEKNNQLKEKKKRLNACEGECIQNRAYICSTLYQLTPITHYVSIKNKSQVPSSKELQNQLLSILQNKTPPTPYQRRTRKFPTY
jgi:hypothetical protein